MQQDANLASRTIVKPRRFGVAKLFVESLTALVLTIAPAAAKSESVKEQTAEKAAYNSELKEVLYRLPVMYIHDNNCAGGNRYCVKGLATIMSEQDRYKDWKIKESEDKSGFMYTVTIPDNEKKLCFLTVVFFRKQDFDGAKHPAGTVLFGAINKFYKNGKPRYLDASGNIYDDGQIRWLALSDLNKFFHSGQNISLPKLYAKATGREMRIGRVIIEQNSSLRYNIYIIPQTYGDESLQDGLPIVKFTHTGSRWGYLEKPKLYVLRWGIKDKLDIARLSSTGLVLSRTAEGRRLSAATDAEKDFIKKVKLQMVELRVNNSLEAAMNGIERNNAIDAVASMLALAALNEKEALRRFPFRSKFTLEEARAFAEALEQFRIAQSLQGEKAATAKTIDSLRRIATECGISSEQAWKNSVIVPALIVPIMESMVSTLLEGQGTVQMNAIYELKEALDGTLAKYRIVENRQQRVAIIATVSAMLENAVNAGKKHKELMHEFAKALHIICDAVVK